VDIIPQAPVTIFGLPFEGFNVATLYNTWLVMAGLILCAWLATRSLKREPGRLQVLFEMFTEFFEDLCNSTLGKEHGRKYMPFIATIFLFVFLSNIIGIIPNLLGWLGWPGFYCPTQDLNTPLALALIVLVVVHISAIRVKGFRSWLWSFFEPSFPGEGRGGKIVGAVILALAAYAGYAVTAGCVGAFGTASTAGRIAWAGGTLAYWALAVLMTVYSVQLRRVPNVLIAPLNIVGEAGKAVSHPFRLFGNIFGGFVILTVVSHLIMQIGLPPFLNAFFGLFIGLVQAFVFAMLALAYTAVQMSD